MPITKQAIKKVRQDRRKVKINARKKTALKKAIVVFRKNPTADLLTKLFRIADRAAKTNVIHKNQAARIKSRLSKLVSKPAASAKKPKTRRSKKT